MWYFLFFSRVIDIFFEVVNKYGVVFVSSVGNNGFVFFIVGCFGGIFFVLIGKYKGFDLY